MARDKKVYTSSVAITPSDHKWLESLKGTEGFEKVSSLAGAQARINEQYRNKQEKLF